MGHVISEKGVATDPSKISAMINWPQPKTLKGLSEGILGVNWLLQEICKKLWGDS